MKPHSKLPFNTDEDHGNVDMVDSDLVIVGNMSYASDAEYLAHAANNFQEAIRILKTIKTDAEMALSDEWDRSDDGFKAQLDSIDEFLNKIK